MAVTSLSRPPEETYKERIFFTGICFFSCTNTSNAPLKVVRYHKKRVLYHLVQSSFDTKYVLLHALRSPCWKLILG